MKKCNSCELRVELKDLTSNCCSNSAQIKINNPFLVGTLEAR